jgi:hypothetical protein
MLLLQVVKVSTSVAALELLFVSIFETSMALLFSSCTSVWLSFAVCVWGELSSISVAHCSSSLEIVQQSSTSSSQLDKAHASKDPLT